MKHVAHETAICHDPHNSSNLDSRMNRQLGYDHTFCQNIVSTRKLLVLVFSYKPGMIKCWSIKDMSSFVCLPYNCVSASYDKLLFDE
jgi:hypothetical protein